MFDEANTGTNLPAQIDIGSVPGGEYRFLFIAKGGGSANKTAFFQETNALLNPAALEKFIRDKVAALGTAACPPYHLALVVGGLSAEMNLKTLKLATSGLLDDLPGEGAAEEYAEPFLDREWSGRLLEAARETGLGAQFGGGYLALDARVVRLPRHAASCPVSIGVSCSADRNILGKITSDGVFLEELDRNPGRFLPGTAAAGGFPSAAAAGIDLRRPMEEIRRDLSRLPPGSLVLLSGPVVVARDIAHARLFERLKKEGQVPSYFRDHPVYYAGPSKTPPGYPIGSFGPTTAQRMDSYLPGFMAAGASLVTLAKGNRSPAVTSACREHGGFYLGTIGGAAALLAAENIASSETVDYPELGMEAVRLVEVRDFPAFILVDDKGGDFYASVLAGKG
jgi:fumarate hydratase class I